MAAALVLGFAAIRRRDLPAHRAWMIRAYAVGLAAGTAVGTGGLDHVRLTLATSTEVLTEAVARMGRVSGSGG